MDLGSWSALSSWPLELLEENRRHETPSRDDRTHQFKCPVCSKLFPRKRGLSEHLSNIHGLAVVHRGGNLERLDELRSTATGQVGGEVGTEGGSDTLLADRRQRAGDRDDHVALRWEAPPSGEEADQGSRGAVKGHAHARRYAVERPMPGLGWRGDGAALGGVRLQGRALRVAGVLALPPCPPSPGGRCLRASQTMVPGPKFSLARAMTRRQRDLRK